ncbi:cytochrome P450 71D10-like [Lycium ferocissimum]|uniref:cytochrome P450 71D10-like n=1 Tax=Lycium ferocissimum TaxID=112874 RepID=UPI002814C80E|nr:cytochrome P450 71D10-like [Lycium ferocissimum]
MDTFTVLSASILFFIVLVKILKKFEAKNSTMKLPPGPKKLPIIGNMHQLLGSQIHHKLRDLAMKYGPLMHLQLGEISTIIVSSPDIAKEIMQTHDVIFAQRPYLLAPSVISYNCNIGFSPCGTYWRQLRKICATELLTSKRVQSFRSIREEEVYNLISSFSINKGSIINLSARIFSMTYAITARAAFGKENKYQEDFIKCVEDVVKVYAGFSISDVYPSIKLLETISGMRAKVEKVHKRIDAILEHIINEHTEKNPTPKQIKKEENEDAVDVLLKIQKDGDLEVPLTRDNIKAVLMDIFAAGSDTSATAAEWVMAELLKNPLVMERAQIEIREAFQDKGNVEESGICKLKYFQSVIKETMRLHPPVPLLLPRESREPCEINGYKIPAKTRVIVNAWAIGRDPKQWSEPEKFHPERFLDSTVDYMGHDFRFLPFGAGRRICPGILFGLADIELPLAQLLYHFDWKLPGEEELDMTEKFALTVRPKNHLQLIPVPYDPYLSNMH